MFMFWIAIFLIAIVISSLLAYRSMKNLQDIPAPGLPYGLFLIRNKAVFNKETLEKLYVWSLNLKATFSLEKLFRGSQSAFVVFAPLGIVEFLPELQLLQLENYLPKVSDSFVWQISPKLSPKKLVVGEAFLKKVNLSEQQQFFWQVVCFPQKKGWLQVTIRAMVVDQEQMKRIELAKAIDKHISDSTGLIKQRGEINSNLYDNFEKRAVTKKEVEPFLLSVQEVLTSLG